MYLFEIIIIFFVHIWHWKGIHERKAKTKNLFFHVDGFEDKAYAVSFSEYCHKIEYQWICILQARCLIHWNNAKYTFKYVLVDNKFLPQNRLRNWIEFSDGFSKKSISWFTSTKWKIDLKQLCVYLNWFCNKLNKFSEVVQITIQTMFKGDLNRLLVISLFVKKYDMIMWP